MKRLIAAEREYEAKRDADPNGYRIPYGWLEMLSHLSYVVLAIIWGVSTISYLKVLDVGWWYCWQVLVPSITVSTLFILGKPLYEVHNIKHSWRPILGFLWTLLFSVAGAVVGVTFIILKIVFVANSDPSDPTTIRATHVGGFAVLICFCCALVVLDVIVSVLVVKLWLRKPHSD
jgi:hypothetical protein